MKKMIPTNAAYDMAQAYLRTSFALDAKGFEALLSNDVTIEHSTNGKLQFSLSGKEAVMKKMMEVFFNVTSNFHIHNVKIDAKGLESRFLVNVEETKQEKSEKTRYRFSHLCELTLKEDTFKIAKIVNIVAKIAVQDLKTQKFA